ncbi:Uncharacterized protein TPAR_08989 [Tolypocladium paradoxum]|uniref:Uncharacterized protein n=1 Tax=Tolypocladium paradoxum TaxID=94208 RepID=A0A2S4KU80_9HYPO|nr:Uncharacterized protein TPAR_08989 [Tolypocladium paradoxum]
MLATTLLSLACFGLSACSAIDTRRGVGRSPTGQDKATISNFSWKGVANETGVDPFDYLPSSDSHAETLACTKAGLSPSAASVSFTNIWLQGDGPGRLDCPHAMQGWDELVDKQGFLNIDAGQCWASSKGCCQTVVCAPSSDELRIRLGEATGRMWMPLTTKCVSGGRGGLWVDKGWKLYVQLVRPASDQCLGIAP